MTCSGIWYKLPASSYAPFLRSPVGTVIAAASSILCAVVMSPSAKSPTTTFSVAHISVWPVTLVSKNSCLSLSSCDRFHCFFAVHTWGRNGALNCSPKARFLRVRLRCEISGVWDEVRGLEVSGSCCVGAEVMAREEESPCALEGEYGDDSSSSRAVE